MSVEDAFSVPYERTFDGAYGLRWLGGDGTLARGRVDVAPALLGAHGAVHSGIFAAIAESLASIGTALEVVPQGFAAAGLSNSTHVLAEVREGVLEATARRRARAAGEWLWDVEVRAGETLCAVTTVVIAVRPQRR